MCTTFCPGQDLNESKVSVLVFAIVNALADETFDDRRKCIAIEAMVVIFDDRLASDKELLAIVDTFSFSLSSTEQSDDRYFTDGAKYACRRKYFALNYALLLLLGRQYGELIAATDDLEYRRDGFQLAFLRSSISELAEKVVKQTAAIKNSLFSVSIFQRGHVSGAPCFEAMEAIIDQSMKRKGDFCASKMILNDR